MGLLTVRVFRLFLLGIGALIVVLSILHFVNGPILKQHTILQMSSTNEEMKETLHLSLQAMTSTHMGQITIHHQPFAKELAINVANKIKEIFTFIKDEFGFNHLNLTIALFNQQNYNLSEVEAVRITRRVWPIFVSKDWKRVKETNKHFRTQLVWTLPHEAIETKIAQSLYLFDSKARWFGDGLAEYIAFNVALHQAPDIACSLIDGHLDQTRQLIQTGQSHYNLVKDFPVRSSMSKRWTDVEVAGYSVAFAFWYGLVDEYSDSSIKSFWKEWRSQFRVCLLKWCLLGPNARDAASLLAAQTGEDVWSNLQSVQLNHVVKILKEAQRKTCE